MRVRLVFVRFFTGSVTKWRFILVYDEFLRSARKHLKTCIVIKDYLDNLEKENPKNDQLIKALTLNLYYISGYVIECSIKYGIYVYSEYGRELCVKKFDIKINNINVTYNKQIKNHRYDRYADFLNFFHSGIVLIDDKSDISQPVKNLYNNWDVDIRYCFNDIPEKFKHSDNSVFVIEFFNYAKEIFHTIQDKLR